MSSVWVSTPMTQGEEKVVSEAGYTSTLPGNEHRPELRQRRGADALPARIQKRADAAGLGGGLGTPQKTLAGSIRQRRDHHSLMDAQKALPVLLENKLGTLRHCTKQRADQTQTSSLKGARPDSTGKG